MPSNATNPLLQTNYGGTINNGYEQKQCCRYYFQSIHIIYRQYIVCLPLLTTVLCHYLQAYLPKTGVLDAMYDKLFSIYETKNEPLRMSERYFYIKIVYFHKTVCAVCLNSCHYFQHSPQGPATGAGRATKRSDRSNAGKGFVFIMVDILRCRAYPSPSCLDLTSVL